MYSLRRPSHPLAQQNNCSIAPFSLAFFYRQPCAPLAPTHAVRYRARFPSEDWIPRAFGSLQERACGSVPLCRPVVHVDFSLSSTVLYPAQDANYQCRSFQFCPRIRRGLLYAPGGRSTVPPLLLRNCTTEVTNLHVCTPQPLDLSLDNSMRAM